MARCELEKRIVLFPYDKEFSVNTTWDLGYGDDTAIWFFQILHGAVRLVGYYANSGEALGHYLDKLNDLRMENRWSYGKHYVPHDIQVHSWTSGKTRIQEMLEQVHKRRLGKYVVKIPNHKVEDGIDATRRLLGICQFDAGPCAEGIKALKNYRKDWDSERGVWKDRPRHDSASHAADAFRGLAVTYLELRPEPAPPETFRDPGGKWKIVLKPEGAYGHDLPRSRRGIRDGLSISQGDDAGGCRGPVSR
jgi:hypothetical protein